MGRSRLCPDCGTELGAEGAPDGICTPCLMKLAIGGRSAAEDRESAHHDGSTACAACGAPDAEPIRGYRILRKLGEGAMGEVYEGEQERPVRRKVALKLIKWGMDTGQVVARFESERQALARMSHPNIARVFDAGATELGRPYFAMEYVSGEPIVAYCDRHRLSIGDRLELFTQVCRAVHHAHQKGVIHRDIKSSNVLVAVDDGKPVPKIIDFGVAKATEQRLTEEAIQTQAGTLIGTPAYMSPEQAEMTGADIDTRTDVYSLGVLLYELLVGALPLDPRELPEAGFDEIRRRIREEEPSRPSARLSSLGDASNESARKRGLDLPTLRRELRGDLDWITMKALDKDRTRRYGSPNELADDVRRHLDHRAVVAGPPSVGYRAGKFVRRHRVGVGFSAVLGLLLLALAASMTLQARRTAIARDRAAEEAATAEQVSEFLVGLFEVSDPDEAQGRTITAQEILDRGAERIEEELGDRPVVRARLMQTMGRVYRNMGSYERAGELLGQALEVQRKNLGPDHEETLKTLNELSWVSIKQGRMQEAALLHREILDVRRRLLGDEHEETLAAMNRLGNSLRLVGEYGEAEPLLARALEGQREVLGPGEFELLATMVNLATLYHMQRRSEEAEPLMLEALEAFIRLRGEEHTETQNVRMQTALVLRELGKFDEAEALINQVLAVRRSVLGPEHDDTMHALTMLAINRMRQERYDEAERMLLQVSETLKRNLGPQHHKTFTAVLNLAHLYQRQGRLDEAEERFVEALDAMRGDFPDHPATLEAEFDLAQLYMRREKFEDAASLFAAIAKARREVLGVEHRYTLGTFFQLARARAALGERDAAIDALRRAVEGGHEFEGGPGGLRDDPCLGVLSGDAEFEALIARIEGEQGVTGAGM